jgi:hypothetical protein
MPAGSAPVQRLVEREQAFGSLHTFLNELTTQRRGQLTIGGPSGVGRSAFLEEAQQRAQVHGFMVLPLRGSAGLRMSDYGALHEALSHWPTLPHPFVSTALWTESSGLRQSRNIVIPSRREESFLRSGKKQILRLRPQNDPVDQHFAIKF